ncbi:MAG: hypothetical protein LBE44_00775 [Microbacterium hominis]|nr:hypothetical protein [Microbacterium hominis]
MGPPAVVVLAVVVASEPAWERAAEKERYRWDDEEGAVSWSKDCPLTDSGPGERIDGARLGV